MVRCGQNLMFNHAVHIKRVFSYCHNGAVRTAVRTVRVCTRSGRQVFGAAGGGYGYGCSDYDREIGGSPISQGREHRRKHGNVLQSRRGSRKSRVHQSEFPAHCGKRDQRQGRTAEQHQRGMVLAKRLFENTGQYSAHTYILQHITQYFADSGFTEQYVLYLGGSSSGFLRIC